MEDKPQTTSAKAQVASALRLLGLPMLEDENFQNTPTRWIKYITSYMVPYSAGADLGVTYPPRRARHEIYDRAMVVQVGIPYRACCAHHLLPVLGTAHVGYIPKDRVVGLSKITRLVYGYSHQMPSLQEDVCDEITHALMTHLKPEGAMCVISAEHGCMAARGVEEATGCIQTVTSSVKGIFRENTEAREEFYHLVDRGT